MAQVIRMPRMSDTMTEGTFVEWHKKVGDSVKPGDILAEVETDKATMELENYEKGTLLYIGVEKGQAAQVDQIIAIVGKEGEDYKSLLEADGAKKEEGADKEEKEKPEEKEKIESKDEKETEEEKISVSNDQKKEKKVAEKEEETDDDDSTENERIKASPLAKKMAGEKGFKLSDISGSGPDGRIIKKDVENFVPETKEKVAEQKQPMMQITEFSGEESFEDVPVSQMRKTIAKRLSESKFTSPHFYLTVSVNMDQAIASRRSMNEVSPVKISFNDLIVKACAMALRQHPAVNSSWLGDKIRMNKHIHIGVAVAVNEGLLVPVIRFADNKSLAQIAMETNDLAAKAKNKKLQPHDWEGNTFTISNLGMMGIEEFTAIINPPDACILAVGSINQVPVIKNGIVAAGNVMKMTMSCDHRAVDGAVGARFLQTLKQYLEEPVRILL
ncbi:MAG: pyruvate dehydrogenase complex dihydrolipoamide acetyltransferase [Chitinophagales bacterium]